MGALEVQKELQESKGQVAACAIARKYDMRSGDGDMKRTWWGIEKIEVCDETV